MKYTVANDELNLKGKSGLYAFFPFEQLDIHRRGVFKIGLTTSEYSKRVEQYHTYLPMGVYYCFLLVAADIEDKKEQSKTIRSMENDLIKFLIKFGAKNIITTTRLKASEWYYTDFKTLEHAFEFVRDKYPKSKLKKFHPNDINSTGEKNMNAKNTYVGQIAYRFK